MQTLELLDLAQHTDNLKYRIAASQHTADNGRKLTHLMSISEDLRYLSSENRRIAKRIREDAAQRRANQVLST